MRVENILRNKGNAVCTIEPSASVEKAVNEFRIRGIGALVVTGDGRHIDGMVSERDITMGLAHHGAAVLRMSVGQIMTTPARTCAPEDTVQEVMHEMTHRRLRHLPVVMGDDLIGIVSIGDVVKNRLEDLELEATLMRDMYLSRR